MSVHITRADTFQKGKMVTLASCVLCKCNHLDPLHHYLAGDLNSQPIWSWICLDFTAGHSAATPTTVLKCKKKIENAIETLEALKIEFYKAINATPLVILGHTLHWMQFCKAKNATPLVILGHTLHWMQIYMAQCNSSSYI